MGMNWFDKLESQLNEQLETFLSSNPEQKKLLDQEESEERQEKLLKRYFHLQRETEFLQQELLELAPKINYWKSKLKQAQNSKQWRLVEEASNYQKDLMHRGKTQWQALKELEFELVQLNHSLKILKEIAQENSSPSSKNDSKRRNQLDNRWEQFETQQELERLRRHCTN
ncbi:hypothetical protein PMYN1_Chma414 (chromatophore) [Paulinella micropora]|uniref:TIGR04376 family protein n=1 Tax=Paulinella micropora TaxID=1928728 RepID=A0A1S6YI49_9EUKA|nr:hypothetical protein PFK_457 [Paulinella micropora]BBL86223.1 hypothetical protein PMYN1_Chma414 [Paulinella micropora]